MLRAVILIVEDDKNVADALRAIFSAQDYEIFAADNNACALDVLNSHDVDIAVLDISLGTDSGYDLCRSIRRFSDMPILFLTACSSELELIRGFQSGGEVAATRRTRRKSSSSQQKQRRKREIAHKFLRCAVDISYTFPYNIIG